MNTAEKIYQDIIEMPISEREKLFAIIARKGFDKDLYTHGEVFEDIKHIPFSFKEAAEYLEISEITLRRWIKAGKVAYKKIGRQLVFSPEDLKTTKRRLPRNHTSASNSL